MTDGSRNVIAKKTTKKEAQNESKDKDTILESLDKKFELDDAIEEKHKTRTSTRQNKKDKYYKIAKEAFIDFIPSKVSKKSREQDIYFSKDKVLNQLQAISIIKGMETLKRSSSKKGSLVNNIFLSKKGLKILDGKFNKPPKDVQSVFDELLKIWEHQKEFYRKHPLAGSPSATVCDIKRQAEQMIESITSSIDEPSNQGTEADLNASGEEYNEHNVESLIVEKVALQMENSSSPENKLIFNIPNRATQEDIKKEMQYLELTSGPADVTAYHDFYDLQIAFPHVWEELFDRQLIVNGKKAFAELARIRGEILGFDFSWLYLLGGYDTITSGEELQQLTKELSLARMAVAEDDERFRTVKEFVPEIDLYDWASFDESLRKLLYELFFTHEFWMFDETEKKMKKIAREAIEANKIKKSAEENFLEDLERRMKENYVFDIFAIDKENKKAFVNFGILVQYRQEWKPLQYQVGELVSTITLAPKESRKYSIKRIVKKNRSEQEIETAMEAKKEDISDTYRVNAEIVRKATNKTGFKMTAEGGVNFGVGDAKGTLELTKDSELHSSEVKQEFREAVIKASQEYKNEHKLEVVTSISEETDETSISEITNPNDEIPVTFLFYELQRCYEIKENIYKLIPVILVANDVPWPDEIDEDWLLIHDWILKRVILDKSMLPALDYLSQDYVGDKISIDALRLSFLTQLDIVEELKRQLSKYEYTLRRVTEALNLAIEEYSNAISSSNGGLFGSIGGFLIGGGNESEALRVRLDAAKDAFERAERRGKELESQLEKEITALESAIDKYTTAVKSHFNQRTQILRLRAHVKDNILYYMQAIWDYEPPDQRFFRLYDLEAPDIVCRPESEIIFSLALPAISPLLMKITIPPHIETKDKKLVEIADLENMLGYKGNYMIFPLKNNNCVTQFMMQDYIELGEIAQLTDPDPFGNYTIDEFRDILRCLYKNNPDMFTPEVREQLRDIFVERLSNPYPDKELIIVPTNSTYIEALPGKHPILEDFKLLHRSIDVKKVQAEVRHAELENIRLAARALNGDYEDPDIEKKIVIEGNVQNIDVQSE